MLTEAALAVRSSTAVFALQHGVLLSPPIRNDGGSRAAVTPKPESRCGKRYAQCRFVGMSVLKRFMLGQVRSVFL